MDNEKLFEFMEKMYADLKNDQKKMYAEMKEGFKSVNNRLDKLESGQIRLENELKDAKKTLYDGYVQNAEGIKKIEAKLEELSDKVDNHDIKIQVIEGGKKAL